MNMCPKCKRRFSDKDTYCYDCKKFLVYAPVEHIIDEYTPKCPTCGSPNIHKISVANKIGSAALFGVFSIGHVGKTYKCDNCGSEF